MNGIRMARLLAFMVSLAACWPLVAGAAPPWEKLLTSNRVEADPEKSYQLTEDNGPWMIMACSFSGDGAEQQARDLVLELRKRYKLSAYSHRMRFDFSDAFGRGCDRFGGPVRVKYQRGSEIQEIAVLVGNYQAVDDLEAQEALRKVKYLRPDCLETKEGKKTNANLGAWRLIQQQILAPNSEKKQRGPMGHAFVTTNPLLPKEYFVPKGIDGFVLKMNENVEHSLLDCPGKYTVQVAHFTGRVILDQAEIRAISSGKEMKSQLADAAEKAHLLSNALREKGYEAYEFHDRYASIVTVGSFDSAGTPRADGRIEINPKIHAIMKTFAGEPANLPGQPAGAMKPKILAGIPFDIQPIPVEVPRRSIAADYRRDAVSRR